MKSRPETFFPFPIVTFFHYILNSLSLHQVCQWIDGLSEWYIYIKKGRHQARGVSLLAIFSLNARCYLFAQFNNAPFCYRFAAKRQMLQRIMRIGEERNPTSPEDIPYHVFIEQLQRIADQLSMAIEGLIAAAAAMAWIHLYVTRHTGVIHGDQYEILDQFSIVSFFRASPCF